LKWNKQISTLPTETAAEALGYMMTVTRANIADQPSRHQALILDIDQMPISFTYTSKNALEVFH
jgi:hypothetical protein